MHDTIHEVTFYLIYLFMDSYYGIWHVLVLLFILFLRKATSGPEKFLQQITIEISIPNEPTPTVQDPSKCVYCDPKLVLSIQQSPTGHYVTHHSFHLVAAY